MHVQPHHTAEELAACIRAEACAKVARRLTAVRRLALLGQAPEQVGPQALHSPPAGPHLGRTLQRRRPPRPPRPQGPGAHGSAECRAGAAPEVAHPGGPTPADGCCAFRGEDAQRILKEELGVLRGLTAVYELLHRLGLEPLRPRPRSPKADPAAQEAFTKSCPSGSPR